MAKSAETKTKKAEPKAAPKVKAASPVPAGYHRITASLTCRDAVKAIEFYKKAFGAEEVMCMRGPDGKVMHAEMKMGDSLFMMNDEAPAWGCQSPQALGGSPVGFYLYVEDADAAWKRAIDAGGKEEMPLTDMFWGDRCGKLKDPFGYSWNLATRVEDLTPVEIEKRQAKFFADMAKGGECCPGDKK